MPLELFSAPGCPSDAHPRRGRGAVRGAGARFRDPPTVNETENPPASPARDATTLPPTLCIVVCLARQESKENQQTQTGEETPVGRGVKGVTSPRAGGGRGSPTPGVLGPHSGKAQMLTWGTELGTRGARPRPPARPPGDAPWDPAPQLFGPARDLGRPGGRQTPRQFCLGPRLNSQCI